MTDNVTINEKYTLRKMGFKFRKIAFYVYFAIKLKPFWSYEAMRG